MSENELMTKGQSIQGMNVGAVAIEQERAIAEVKGQIFIAKQFPRNLASASAELMESCKLPSLATVAFYSVPRAGGTVTGPSIRLAEEIARVCGNIKFGHRELSRDNEKSEVEVYAWDMQNNNYVARQLTVMHVRDTKNGPMPLRDQRDVDDLIANKASKQLRGRILAVVPQWLVADAIQECKKTLAGNNDIPLSVKARKLSAAFAKYGITPEHIERKLGHSMDQILLDEYLDLVGIGNAIKEGMKASDFFGSKDEPVISQDVKNLEKSIIGAVSPAPVAPAVVPVAGVTDGKATQPKAKKVAEKPQVVEPVPAEPVVPVISTESQNANPEDGDIF